LEAVSICCGRRMILLGGPSFSEGKLGCLDERAERAAVQGTPT